MDIRRAHVLFKDRRAGLLEETPRGGSVFRYLDGWTETIACALPDAERRSNWDVGLHPVFQHLGPEGWLRQRQARAGPIQQEDDFGLLLLNGRGCIGEITEEPETQ